MAGRHRTDITRRRAGWFVATTFTGTAVLLAAVTASSVPSRPSGAGTPSGPETDVTMRTYPVPHPTASRSVWRDHLRAVRPTQRPTRVNTTDRRREAEPEPTVSLKRRRRPSRVCYVFRFPGYSARYCVTGTAR